MRPKASEYDSEVQMELAQVCLGFFISDGRELNYSMCCCLHRQSSIEDVIGHTQQEHRMRRNYFKEIEGDKSILSS